MKKVLKHLKRNAAIYLVLLVCVVVLLIALLYKPKDSIQEVDTSLFKVVDVNGTIKLFNDNTPKFLVISTALDQATVNYVDHLKYSMLSNNYIVYFLYQDRIDFKKDNIEKLNEYLDMEVINGEKGKNLIDCLKDATVPITVVIKNKKIVYAYIGTMNTTSLESLIKVYGLNDTTTFKSGDVDA